MGRSYGENAANALQDMELLGVLFSPSLYLRPDSACPTPEHGRTLRFNVLTLLARLAHQSESVQIPQVEKVVSVLLARADSPRYTAEVAQTRTRRVGGAIALRAHRSWISGVSSSALELGGGHAGASPRRHTAVTHADQRADRPHRLDGQGACAQWRNASCRAREKLTCGSHRVIAAVHAGRAQAVRPQAP